LFAARAKKSEGIEIMSRDVLPGYYAIIPATVRYDKSLPQGAKLLYGEISALCNKKGFCWARNEYFSELYETSERTISAWIQRLRDAGHIDIYFEYFPDSKKIKNRFISMPKPKSKVEQPMEPEPEAADDDLVLKKSSPPDGLVLKKSSPPSVEENFRENNTASFNNKAAAAANNTAAENSEKNEKTKEAEAAFCDFKILDLKSHFLKLSHELVFDEPFYQEVLKFLSDNNVGLDFVSWLYKECSKKKPRSLVDYFFTIIFKPRFLEAYRNAAQPPPPKAVVLDICPVCSTEFDVAKQFCPSCGFSIFSKNNTKEIGFYVKYYSLPPNKKNAYDAQLAELLNSSMPFEEKMQKRKDLRADYGLTWP
jgi:hypothetical protein